MTQPGICSARALRYDLDYEETLAWYETFEEKNRALDTMARTLAAEKQETAAIAVQRPLKHIPY